MIMSNRDEFVGLHTTEDAKKALERERDKTGKSVSKIAHEILVAGLRERGHQLKEEAA